MFGMAGSEREHVREKSLMGQAAARVVVMAGGRRCSTTSGDVARKLAIPTGKNKGPAPFGGECPPGARRRRSRRVVGASFYRLRDRSQERELPQAAVLGPPSAS
ncbi:hypothetical protein [Nonomuraea sp. bgisy101]|uniref:hypothetical protein n=1 Tax=Nonomuraea sp. bgisy101 TaxID=3413784 RepID=UPI003D76370D